MKRQRLTPLLVIAAGLLAYHNSFTGPFIFDDLLSIRNNRTIRHLWPIGQALSPPHRDGLTVEGRPMINLSLAVNYALGGYNVWGYHALNLTIHILAGLTLLGIVRRTLLQPSLRERFGAVANELALAVAVLWTVHPLQTESVTYMVQRAESIMGLFYLLTLYCFIRGVDSPRSRLWYGLSVIACALGMASKEVMVSAPLIVMLYDRAFLSVSFREAWRRRWPLYLGLSGTWILLGYLAVSADTIGNTWANAHLKAVAWWGYLLTEPRVILHYLWLSVWPYPLCLDYYGWPKSKTWATILPPAFAIAILIGASIWAWRANPARLRAGPAWGFLGAWFLLILAPSSSFIPLDSPVFEHRMYLPLAAVIVLAVIGLHTLVGEQSVAVVIVLATGLAFLTWQRNQDYRSEFAIWQDTVDKCPYNSRAHNNLGNVLKGQGQVSEAVWHWDQALSLNPNLVEAHNNLGAALWQQNKLQDAINHYQQALRTDPQNAQAHFNLAVALEQTGKREDAIDQYQQALRTEPDMAEAHNNLAVILMRSGKLPEAVAHFKEALQFKPDYIEAHNNLASALTSLGRVEEAIGQWEQALRINPDYFEAHYNLGIVLERVGRVREAKGHYELALRIRPGFAPAQDSLNRLRSVP